MKQRLFIAIPVPEKIKQDLIKKIILPDNFKITGINNIHITILFLGDTDDKIIPDIITNLEKSATSIKTFKISIDNLGQFPEKGYPKIIYASGKTGENELIKSANIIRASLLNLGFKDDKDFKYHITLARQKYLVKNTFKMPDISFNYSFDFEKIVLYKSDLKPAGPVYSEIWSKKI